MDLKQLVTRFAYKIEPKPDGGFIARATDPSAPPIEALTREELQQKIRQNILNALSADFPDLKLPAEGKQVALLFHVEHKPGGGFSIHSGDPNAAIIEAADHNDFESKFLEKFLGFAGKHVMPELSRALAAQVGSANIKVVVNGKTSFRLNSSSEGLIFGVPKTVGTQADAPQDVAQFSGSDANLRTVAGTLDSKPITPESSSSWKVIGLLLVGLILGGLIYLFLHSR